jgi:hypothetical protein
MKCSEEKALLQALEKACDFEKQKAQIALNCTLTALTTICMK